MNGRILCIIIFLSPIYLKAQWADSLKFNDIRLGIGHIEYMNSTNLSSGLPGIVSRLEYRTGHLLKSNPNFMLEFGSRADYGYLLKNDISTDLNSPFHHGEIKIDFICHRQIPTSISHLFLDGGIGISFNGLIGDNSLTMRIGSVFDPYGNWYFSPDLHFNVTYKTKRLNIRLSLNAPLVAAGFFQEYQSAPAVANDKFSNHPLNYFLSPNSVALINNYFRIEMNSSITYLVYTTKKANYYLKANYTYESLNASINHNIEKKQKELLSLGLLITKK